MFNYIMAPFDQDIKSNNYENSSWENCVQDGSQV